VRYADTAVDSLGLYLSGLDHAPDGLLTHIPHLRQSLDGVKLLAAVAT
jgi:hypothetical protein